MTVWLVACAPLMAGDKLVLTSLPNPNVYAMFIAIDQGYLDADFIPAYGSVASLLTLMKSGQADATLLNRMPAENMAEAHHWQLIEGTIVRAVHLLSYTPIGSRDDIEQLTIIAAFPGGSPDKIFTAGGFTVIPKFTDPYLAMQLFLKKDYPALLLPEPYISQVAGLLRNRGEMFFISDMQQLCLGAKTTDINAGVVRQGFDPDLIAAAFKKAGRFIHQNPRRATEIVAAGFEKHFHKTIAAEALYDALASGRLKFAEEQND
ncbi:MAG: hypothetical protein JW773_06320 [Desulfuromonadales bacterium]|nr:hypothetical protein [Desulfuromonadales bacterium]